MLQINESTVLLNVLAEDFHQLITLLADALYQQGFVTEEYGNQACMREEIHPTGLPTKPFCIAFPHADCDGVIQSALAVAILEKPVMFKNMADPDEGLNVDVVIMLANADPGEQVQTLRHLASLFGQGEKLLELKNQTSPENVVSWLKKELQLEDSVI